MTTPAKDFSASYLRGTDGHTKINPIYRPQTEVQIVFSKLSIGKGKKYILVTTGGISMNTFSEVQNLILVYLVPTVR